MKRADILILLAFIPVAVAAQPDTSLAMTGNAGLGASHNTLTPHTGSRVRMVGGVHAAGYAGSLIILNAAWFKGYARTSFHTFNDLGEWNQVDKVGHAWTAYNLSRASASVWKWTGLPEKKAVLIGSMSGFVYMTVIEFLDAHSSKWGWSWGDIGANVAGTGIFLSQELMWHEQRIQFKFSFHRKDYGSTLLNDRADELFGETWYERMLKDYNGQIYWLSANIKSFLKQSNVPSWLSVSVGYGAEGMFGGFENVEKDDYGSITFDQRDIPRTRQFYLSPDIDLTRIKTNKKWLKTTFFILNAFKFPAPAVMFDSKGKFRAYAVYF